MNKILIIIALIGLFSNPVLSEDPKTDPGSESDNPNYDAELAKKLGADDYGMKSYVFVILKTGSNTSTDQDLKSKAFKGHFENINHLVEKQKMIVAGPMVKNPNNYRGIFILDVENIEQAEAVLANDTAIAEKYLEAEYYQWYGSAALPVYLESADKVWKKGI